MTGPAVVPVQGGTTSQYATSSTTALTQALRRALLDYAWTTGATARGFLKERLYISRAPDNKPVWPYAVMRLETSNDGRAHGMRRDGTLEVQVYGRPWAQLVTVNEIADLFDQAMLTLKMTTQGLAFCHGSQRAELPVGGDPVDSECCTVRLSYTLGIWPNYLTRLTRVLPPNDPAPTVQMPVRPADVWFELYGSDGLAGPSSSGHPFSIGGAVTNDGTAYTFGADGQLVFLPSFFPLNDTAAGFTMALRASFALVGGLATDIVGLNAANGEPAWVLTLENDSGMKPNVYGVYANDVDLEAVESASPMTPGDAVLTVVFDRTAPTGSRTRLFRNGTALPVVDTSTGTEDYFLVPRSGQIGLVDNNPAAPLVTQRDYVIWPVVLSDADVLASATWLLARP